MDSFVPEGQVIDLEIAPDIFVTHVVRCEIIAEGNSIVATLARQTGPSVYQAKASLIWPVNCWINAHPIFRHTLNVLRSMQPHAMTTMGRH